MKYAVGDEFPEVIFNWMDDKFEVQKAGSGELFDGKKIILIGMPGAFSPTCSMMHLPSFIKSAKEFNNLGIDENLKDQITLVEWPEIVKKIKIKNSINLIFEYKKNYSERYLSIISGNKKFLNEFK